MNTSLTVTDQRIEKVADYETQVVNFFRGIMDDLERVESGELGRVEISLNPVDARALGKYAMELYKEWVYKVDSKVGSMQYRNSASISKEFVLASFPPIPNQITARSLVHKENSKQIRFIPRVSQRLLE